jgi:hypothetical protein
MSDVDSYELLQAQLTAMREVVEAAKEVVGTTRCGDPILNAEQCEVCRLRTALARLDEGESNE